jgi:hypothetical protein
LTDAFAASRFASSFAGSFFGRRFAFTARGVFAVCRCVAAILPLASPFFKLLLSLAFCLAAANDGLVGANNGLVGANDSLAAANNKLLRRKAFVCAFFAKRNQEQRPLKARQLQEKQPPTLRFSAHADG